TMEGETKRSGISAATRWPLSTTAPSSRSAAATSTPTGAHPSRMRSSRERSAWCTHKPERAAKTAAPTSIHLDSMVDLPSADADDLDPARSAQEAGSAVGPGAHAQPATVPGEGQVEGGRTDHLLCGQGDVGWKDLDGKGPGPQRSSSVERRQRPHRLRGIDPVSFLLGADRFGEASRDAAELPRLLLRAPLPRAPRQRRQEDQERDRAAGQQEIEGGVEEDPDEQAGSGDSGEEIGRAA